VLASALLSLDVAGRERLFGRLGDDTGSTLRSLLDGPTPSRTRAQPAAGAAKVRQDWDRAWAEWNACIFEAANEDGDYVHQDEHWEPPYFDATSLGHDLEKIAARIRPLLAEVLKHNLDPDFSFAGTLQQAVEEIFSAWETRSSSPSWQASPPIGVMSLGRLSSPRFVGAGFGSITSSPSAGIALDSSPRAERTLPKIGSWRYRSSRTRSRGRRMPMQRRLSTKRFGPCCVSSPRRTGIPERAFSSGTLATISGQEKVSRPSRNC
jgi:hypothetical protein